MNNIVLNTVEQKIAKYIANQRYENARSKNIIDCKIGTQSNYDTDLEGISSEIAFCKAYNIYPNLENNIDDGFDVIYNGFKIDIKSTKYKSGCLLATLKQKNNNNVDIFVLVIGRFPGPYTVIGAATKQSLINEQNIKDLGRGKGYVLEQKDLKDVTNLINGW